MLVSSICATYIVLQIIGGLIAGLSTADIFQYRNRKKQMKICTMGILLLLLWIGFFAYDYYINSSVSIIPLYALLPVVSIILFWMAKKGIKADDDLVRSADRIR